MKNEKHQVVPISMCFLVGRWLEDASKPWEVQGIYDSEDDAKEACIDGL